MPITKALPIKLSSRTEQLLQQIVKGTTNPYRLVRRAKLILGAASGESNSSISRKLEIDREQVALWRERWREQSEKLAAAEEQQVTDKKLRALMEQILSDHPRPGTKKSFTVEQVVQIVAIACESPEKSERPVSHWTAKELALRSYQKRNCRKDFPPKCGAFF